MTDDQSAAVDDADGSVADDDVERWQASARARHEIIVLTSIGVLLVLVFGPITYIRSWIDDQVYDATIVSATELRLSVGSCGLERRVQVSEHDDTVEVLVQHRRTSNENDCIEQVTARLSTPLGDRRVIDSSTGESVAVCDDRDRSSCAKR